MCAHSSFTKITVLLNSIIQLTWYVKNPYQRATKMLLDIFLSSHLKIPQYSTFCLFKILSPLYYRSNVLIYFFVNLHSIAASLLLKKPKKKIKPNKKKKTHKHWTFYNFFKNIFKNRILIRSAANRDVTRNPLASRRLILSEVLFMIDFRLN